MKVKNRLKIVLDTNVLLVSISESSKYHWLYDALINRKFDLFITNDILTEYEEIISKKWAASVAYTVTRTLTELSNVYHTVSYFRLNLITNDPDDNKFVDCAFTNNVDYLVTNDKDFNVLKSIEFPVIKILTLQEFEPIFKDFLNQ